MKNLSMRKKLIVMLFIPLLGLMFFAVVSVHDKIVTLRAMHDTRSLAQLAVRASGLVHEVQKERGLTAGFIGSRGSAFSGELADSGRKRIPRPMN